MSDCRYQIRARSLLTSITFHPIPAMPTECTIFYSWQSDLPSSSNRNFVLKALENAVKAIRTDEPLEIDPVVDRDTSGVSGSPDIAGTIFSKIDQAKVFVCDVSIINGSTNARPTPNPNVLVELGYAAKTLGWERIIMVMNTAYGSPELLPFDLRARRVVCYASSEEPWDEEDKKNKRKMLESGFKTALRSILTDVIQTNIETNLVLQFANHQSRQELGLTITLPSVVYDKPASWLPDLRNWRNSGVPGLNMSDPISELNADYWREKEEYIREKSLIKPIGMLLHNPSNVLMEQVHVEVKGTFADGIFITDTLPKEPAYRRLDSFSRNIPRFRFVQQEDQTEVLKHGDQWTLNLNFGNIRPKASVWLDEPFYVGSTEAKQLEMRALIYANNLPEPQTVLLLISFEIERRSALTVEKLEGMPPHHR